MNKRDTSVNKENTIKTGTDWARLENMSDEDIDFSDIPELTEEELQRMRPVSEVIPAFARRGKRRITIRLDDEILTFFKQRAKDSKTNYQTLINAILRDFVVRNSHEDGLRRMVREIVREELAGV